MDFEELKINKYLYFKIQNLANQQITRWHIYIWHFKTFYKIVAQWWKLNSQNRLENMAGPWKYTNKSLSIPYGRSTNFIEDTETGNTLGYRIQNGSMLNEVMLGSNPKLNGTLVCCCMSLIIIITLVYFIQLCFKD